MAISPAKRQRERNRQDRAREKAVKRDDRKHQPERPKTPGEDPDIAGIIPGPQPIAEEFL